MGMPPRSTYEQTKKYKSEQQTPNDCIRSIQMGFLMGTSVGCTLGCIFMSLMLVPRGIRGRELWIMMGRTSLKMGLTFGSFMSIGSALHCEDDDSLINNNINNNNNNNKAQSILQFNNNINHKFKNIC